MLHASHSHSGHFKIKGYTFIVSRKFSHKSRQESIKILLQHATKPFLENRVLLFQRKQVEDLYRMEKDRYSVEPNASERKLFREKRHLIIASLRFRSEELWQGVNGRVHGFITGDPTQKNSAQALTME